jgi:hypothetical protein
MKKTYTATLCRQWTRLVGNRTYSYEAGDTVTDLREHEVTALRSIPGRVDEFTENIDEPKAASQKK